AVVSGVSRRVQPVPLARPAPLPSPPTAAPDGPAAGREGGGAGAEVGGGGTWAVEAAGRPWAEGRDAPGVRLARAGWQRRPAARRAAACHLRLQARAHPGRRLRLAPQKHPAAVPSADRRRPGTAAGDRRGAPGAPRPPLHRGGARGAGGPLLVEGRAAGERAL